ncbi:thioredoxin [Candidatus Roizmanbacteria bacterium]|nr:thioredoxin [Candidatus Roizmanbacteria bacterium]
MSTVSHISKDNFQEEVIAHKGLVLVDFYAEWCGPCKLTAPILNELAQELSDVKIVKVDVDQNQDLASDYSIFSIPTFLIFKDGAVVTQFVGAMGKEGFLEHIQTAKSA